MRSWSLASIVAAAGAWAGLALATCHAASGPSFDCGRAESGLSLAICRDPATWPADWTLSAAYWASYFSVDGADRTRLRDGHVAWIKNLERACGLDPSGGATMVRAGSCIVRQYQARAAGYRSGLSGDAAAEAGLGPEALLAIQSRLVALGFMPGPADGVFGAGTRQAIRGYRQAIGHPPADFLDGPERVALMRQPAANEAMRRPGPLQAQAAPAYGPEPARPLDPRAALPGMLIGLLGGGQPGQPPFPRPPYGRRNPADPSWPEGSDARFAGAARPAPPGRPAADPNAGAQEAEFSDAATAVVARPLGEPAPAARSGVRTVEVKGVGDSPDAARKDAARLAIQQAVGIFIDNRRRIELNVSEAKVTEVVNEKLISYTNAYVSKMDVVRTEQKDGTFEVTAKVGVAVGPILKVLQDNSVPTVSFDTASAASTVETLSQEKTGAIELYADLVEKSDTLVKVGVGTPQVDPSLPSSPDEAWLRIPITYSVNDDAAREWRTKLDLIAQQRADVLFAVGQHQMPQDCAVPAPDIRPGWNADRRVAGFLAEQPASQRVGVGACFLSYAGPGSLVAECLGRTFFSDGRGDRCLPGKPCTNLRWRTAQVHLVVELLDGNNTIIFTARNPLEGYPAIATNLSRREPHWRENTFFNYCVSSQTPFFPPLNANSGIGFGDVLVFPPKGSRIRGYLNLRLSNAVISRIGSVRARITKDAT